MARGLAMTAKSRSQWRGTNGARARNDGEGALASHALAMAGNASARESRPLGGPPRASSANHFALIRSFLTVCGRRKAVSTPACAKNLPPVRDRLAGVAMRASRCAAYRFARLRAARRFAVWHDENTCFIETFVIERRSRRDDGERARRSFTMPSNERVAHARARVSSLRIHRSLSGSLLFSLRWCKRNAVRFDSRTH